MVIKVGKRLSKTTAREIKESNGRNVDGLEIEC